MSVMHVFTSVVPSSTTNSIPNSHCRNHWSRISDFLFFFCIKYYLCPISFFGYSGVQKNIILSWIFYHFKCKFFYLKITFSENPEVHESIKTLTTTIAPPLLLCIKYLLVSFYHAFSWHHILSCELFLLLHQHQFSSWGYLHLST